MIRKSFFSVGKANTRRVYKNLTSYSFLSKGLRIVGSKLDW